MARTIKLNFTEEAAPPQFRQALGYLTSWALDAYDEVNIFPDGSNDLIAVYTDTRRPNIRYVIGAVMDPQTGKYSFHS